MPSAAVWLTASFRGNADPCSSSTSHVVAGGHSNSKGHCALESQLRHVRSAGKTEGTASMFLPGRHYAKGAIVRIEKDRRVFR